MSVGETIDMTILRLVDRAQDTALRFEDRVEDYDDDNVQMRAEEIQLGICAGIAALAMIQVRDDGLLANKWENF